MIFYDFENDVYITTEELKESYEELKKVGETEAENFEDYILNCTDKNGTLEIVAKENGRA